MTRMNDVGGVEGFGTVPHVEGSVVQRIAETYGVDGRTAWEADWQARVYALIIALGMNGVCSASELRDAEERAAPGAFLAASYYERVVAGIERLVAEKGLSESR